MSTIDRQYQYIRSQLGPHQVDLVDTILDPSTKPVIQLRAAYGTGTTFASLAATLGILRSSPHGRVLLLLGQRLEPDFISSSLVAEIPIRLVDRYAFREMLDAAPDQNIWDDASIAILPMELAAQEDVHATLMTARWDLVIAHDVHALTGDQIEALVSIGATAKRVLLVGNRRFRPGSKLSPKGGTTILEWKPVEWSSSSPSIVPVIRSPLRELMFDLTQAELDLWETISELTKALSGLDRRPTELSKELLHQLKSSTAALEQGLRRAIAPDPLAYEAFKGGDEDEGQFAPFSPESVSVAKPFVERALRQIEEIRADSKLEAFGGLIDRLSGNKARICVLSEYVATVYYLDAELEGQTHEHRAFHQLLSESDQFRSLTAFDDGATIVTTRAIVNSPADLRKVTDLVLYDLPRESSLLRRAMGQFNRFGRENDLRVHVIEAANPLPSLVVPLRALFPKSLQKYV